MNKKQPSMTSALVLITLVITIFTISLNIGHNSSTETKEGMEKVSGEIVRVTGMANTAEPLSFTIPSSGTIYTETEAGSGIFRNNVDAEIFDSRGRRLNPSSTSDDDKYLNADGDPTGNFDHARLSTNAFEFPNYLNARFNQNGNLLLGEQPVVRSDGEPLESTETLESITTKLLPNGNVEITSGNDIVIVNSDNVVVSTRQIDDATCFLPRTPITLNDGSKKQIQNIKVGDKVLSYDLKNKKPVVSEVLNVFSHLDNNYLIVNDKIKVTPYHNMYINNEWKQIGNAKVGDKLMDKDGNEIKITSIEQIHDKDGVMVYDLEIAEHHYYFAEGVLVHNSETSPGWVHYNNLPVVQIEGESENANYRIISEEGGRTIVEFDNNKNNIADGYDIIENGKVIETVRYDAFDLQFDRHEDFLTPDQQDIVDSVPPEERDYRFYTRNDVAEILEKTQNLENARRNIISIGTLQNTIDDSESGFTQHDIEDRDEAISALRQQIENGEITKEEYEVLLNSESVKFDNFEAEDVTKVFDVDDILVTNRECFLPTTPITLNDGTKKQIQNIKIGDKVLSYDLKNKKPVVSEVLNVFVHEENEYLIVNDKIKVTPYHNMYINNEWKQIGNAKVGDYLMDKDGNKIKITSIEQVHDKDGVMVYDLEIADYHYYFAEDVLVHNSETIPAGVTVTIKPPEGEVAEQQAVTPTEITYDPTKHTRITMGDKIVFISGNNIHNMDGTQVGTNVQLRGNAIIYSPITDGKVGQPTYFGPLGNGVKAKDGKFDFGGDIGTIDIDHINNDGTVWKSTPQGMRYYYHSGKIIFQSSTPIRLLGKDYVELSMIGGEGYTIAKTNGDVVITDISGRTPGKHGMIYRTANGYFIISENGVFVDEEGNPVSSVNRIDDASIKWAYFSSWFGNLLADMADATSGYSGVSFFYDEPKPWLEVDETMSNLLGGIDGWTSIICKADVVDSAEDMGMAMSPFADGAYAHIEGEKIQLTNFNVTPNRTTYLYKISFVVSSGSETRGCDIDFKVKLDDISLFMEDFKTKRDDEEKNTVSYAGPSMLALEYENNYNKLCIHFEKIEPELVTGSTRCLIGVEEGDKICTTIHDGGARRMETEDPCDEGLNFIFPNCWFGGPGTEDEDWTQGEGTGGTLTSGAPASEDGEVILNPALS